MEVTTCGTTEGNSSDCDHHHDHHEHHHMAMWFFTEYDNVVVLFEDWKVTNIGTLLGAIVAIILLALILDGLKCLRQHMLLKSPGAVEYSTVRVPITARKENRAEVLKTIRGGVFTVDHLIQTLLHAVQQVISYVLMLIFMGYNVWLCVAVTLGSALGFILLELKKGMLRERRCVLEQTNCKDPPCHEMESCSEKQTRQQT